jgi:hypothetical protein
MDESLWPVNISVRPVAAGYGQENVDNLAVLDWGIVRMIGGVPKPIHSIVLPAGPDVCDIHRYAQARWDDHIWIVFNRAPFYFPANGYTDPDPSRWQRGFIRRKDKWENTFDAILVEYKPQGGWRGLNDTKDPLPAKGMGDSYLLWSGSTEEHPPGMYGRVFHEFKIIAIPGSGYFYKDNFRIIVKNVTFSEGYIGPGGMNDDGPIAGTETPEMIPLLPTAPPPRFPNISPPDWPRWSALCPGG